MSRFLVDEIAITCHTRWRSKGRQAMRSRKREEHMIRGLKGFSGAIVLAGLLGGLSQAVLADDIVEQAKKDLVVFAGPQSDWRGPTSSPKPATGKKIVYISNDENNDASRAWGVAIKEAGSKLGWDVTIMDGKATPVGWIAAMNQAIALNV